VTNRLWVTGVPDPPGGREDRTQPDGLQALCRMIRGYSLFSVNTILSRRQVEIRAVRRRTRRWSCERR